VNNVSIESSKRLACFFLNLGSILWIILEMDLGMLKKQECSFKKASVNLNRIRMKGP